MRCSSPLLTLLRDLDASFKLVTEHHILGHHGRLGLIMTSYEPSVRCSWPIGESQRPENCDEILMSMPADLSFQRFGRYLPPGTGVTLPLEVANGAAQSQRCSCTWLTRFHVADRSCVATLDTTGIPAVESWFRLWEEMVALEGMCTRNGMVGTSFALGKCFSKLLHHHRFVLDRLTTIGSQRDMFIDVKRGTHPDTASS